MTKIYYKYIGKLDKKKTDYYEYHLLPYHCLDVAATAKALLETNRQFQEDVAQLLEITSEQLLALVCFFVAIHDLGKFATAFQDVFSDKVKPLYKAKNKKPYDGSKYRHDLLGIHFWEKNEEEVLKLLVTQLKSSIDHVYDTDKALDTLLVFAHSTLGHHGKPIDSSNTHELKHFVEAHNEQAALEFIKDLLIIFKPDISFDLLVDKNWQTKLKQVSWHLAGLAVLADWLGSNTLYFPYVTNLIPLKDYWNTAQSKAQKALHDTDVWRSIKAKPFLSVKDHYGFSPTPLQKWAEAVPLDDSPQLFILEDVTGAGKTEAALVLTHRLMEAGAANGFYFGLPTMATSNAMFTRIADHYVQMFTAEDGCKPSIVLAHGARDMNNLFREIIMPTNNQDIDYSPTDLTATAQCNSWLADSRKKALLAPVGVGTIDQALLAVLPRRHQSLRLLGLNRKILIFDEVHSADEYMFELLESLLVLHLHQGGSVILLTATLSKKQRQRLINIWADTLQIGDQLIQNTNFPLSTRVSLMNGLEEIPIESRKEVSRTVQIDFLHTEKDCVDKIVSAATDGQCVVWIRNTVDDVLNAYYNVSSKLDSPESCILFHSRFTLMDRKRIETKVLEIFGKDSNRKMRAGKVLITTQVFQESLDADTDLMISDICPIDDLIQRTGRLHRHTRNANGAYENGVLDSREQPLLYIHAPEWQDYPDENWLSDGFQSTEYVYRTPGRLWLGMQALKEFGTLSMPMQARSLIESVYSEDYLERMPDTFHNKELQHLGEERGKASKGKTGTINWQNHGYSYKSSNFWYEDNTDISTRYSDVETTEVVLLRLNEQNQFDFYSNESEFACQLSSVKLSVKKFVNHLKLISADDPKLNNLKNKYPNLKFQYLSLWQIDNESSFRYDSNLGFLSILDI